MANHNAFPGIAKTTDGLIVVYRAALSHAVQASTLEGKKSTDGGATWGTAFIVHTPAAGLDSRDPALLRLADGRIACTFFLHDGTDYTSRIMFSSDDGDTWSTPVALGSYLAAEKEGVSGPACELADGTLLVAVYGNEAADTFQSVAIVKSTDDGATWTDLAVVADGDTLGQHFQEPNLLLLDNGAVYCAMRTSGEKMTWSTSTDNGATWAPPTAHPSNVSNGRPAVMQATNGAVAWVGRHDEDAFYRTSWDRGATWTAAAVLDTAVTRMAYAQMLETETNELATVYALEDGTASTVKFTYLYDENRDDPLA